MAKIKIPFNNKNYSVDESSLSSASASLKSHLSTAMSGTGATINLNGVSYNVDAAKLTSTKNAFIQHLGTIAGNGHKVVVNGVEYNIDSTKVNEALSELEVLLGGLHSDDDQEPDEPVKNEYGFYYNVPYFGEANMDGVTSRFAYVFYEDNVVLRFEGTYSHPLYWCDNEHNFEYNESTRTIIDDFGFNYVFNEDGNSFALNTNGYWSYYDGVIFSASGQEHGVYYGDAYCGNSYTDDTEYLIVFNEDGSAILSHLDESTTLTNINWYAKGHVLYGDGIELSASMDGNHVYMYDKVNNIEVTFERANGAEDDGAEGNDYVAGLYQTGAIALYEEQGAEAIEGMLIKSWDELVAEGVVHVDNGVVYTNMDEDIWENMSSDALNGDLIFPENQGITTLGNSDTEIDGILVGFTNCYEITGVILPTGLKTIGAGAFMGCESLEYAIIPESVTSIGVNAFNECFSLTSITLPNSIINIGSFAFMDSGSLTNIIFKGTIEQWNAVSKAEFWNDNVPATEVICSDGTVTL